MAKVGVLCEFSGIVREAFRRRGHQAVSCDLVESEIPGPHLVGDCREFDWSGYDLLIAHPPCTYLAVSGARWWKNRQALQEAAIGFVKWILALPVRKIAIENPIGKLSSAIRKPEQIIQPWQFGHPEAKATCLWLKNLPLLKPTNVLEPRGGNPRRGWDNQTPSGQNKLGPSADRAAIRSRTYTGIAEAMAEQWGGLLVAHG